jgi:hypothetical protein
MMEVLVHLINPGIKALLELICITAQHVASSSLFF